MAHRSNLRWLISAGLLAFLFDQFTKAFLLAHFFRDPAVPVLSLFGGRLSFIPTQSLTLAFGLTGEWPRSGQMAFLGLIALLILGVGVALYRGLSRGEWVNALALGLVLGGGAGNLTDELFRGAVIEIMQFGGTDPSAWTRFNFADGFILMGLVVLVVELLVAEGASRVGTSSLPTPDE
jgi:signal peptidase II